MVNIFGKFLIIAYLALLNSLQVLATSCVADCCFKNVNTTQTAPMINPSAKNVSDVKSIGFESSTLHTLTNELCKTFPNLEKLYVKKLSLKHIEKGAFDDCKKLNWFDIYDNDVSKIPIENGIDDEIFKYNVKLVYVSFSNNKLAKINGKMFDNTLKLTALDLDRNLLSEIPFDTFPQLKSLKRLYLRNNDLDDLDETEIFTKFPALEEIYIQGNVFFCDHLRYLLDAFKNKSIQVPAWSDHVSKSRTFNTTTINGVDCVPTPMYVRNLQNHVRSFSHQLAHMKASQNKMTTQISQLMNGIEVLKVYIYFILMLITIAIVGFSATYLISFIKNNAH